MPAKPPKCKERRPALSTTAIETNVIKTLTKVTPMVAIRAACGDNLASWKMKHQKYGFKKKEKKFSKTHRVNTGKLLRQHHNAGDDQRPPSDRIADQLTQRRPGHFS
uniref:Uncharacterized protein n=1 Tax=Romanomermis culicivorax TaxID=13658 RepID=A0A915LD07_ROMCU